MFGLDMSSLIEFVSRTECQASRKSLLSLCFHLADRSTMLIHSRYIDFVHVMLGQKS